MNRREKTPKLGLLPAVLLVTGIATGAIATGAYTPATQAAPAPTLEQMLAEHVMGDPEAPVTMIEYFSLSCSHCRRFHTDILPRLKKTFIDTGKVKLVLRDFPLDRAALAAAMTARCAPPERYFDFIDILFREQENWARSENPNTVLARIAKLGGIGDAAFGACHQNRELVDGILQARLTAHKTFDIRSTPTFIVGDNHKIVGAQSYEEFEKALRKAITR